MSRKPVLIVEDDEGIRTAEKLSMELFGYGAYCASNGAEALALLETIPRPGLILLDLMMPVMDGWTFAETLSRNPVLADIPIVVVTAFSDQTRTLPWARQVIAKPPDLGTLLGTVRQHCG